MIAVGIPLRNEAWEKSSKKKGNGLNLGRNHLLYPQLIVWVILSCIESSQFDVLSLSINNVLCPQINFIFWCWLFTGVGGWPLDPLMQGLANNGPRPAHCPFLYSLPAKNSSHSFEWLWRGSQNKDNILCHVKIIWSSNFSVHKNV